MRETGQGICTDIAKGKLQEFLPFLSFTLKIWSKLETNFPETHEILAIVNPEGEAGSIDTKATSVDTRLPSCNNCQ